MIDTEADILKAFFAALAMQTQPLPSEVQLALNNISEGANIAEKLDSLAESHEPLKTLYEKACTWLAQHSDQQRKGRDVKPQADSEKATNINTELDNVASETQDSNSLSAILENIQKRLNNEQILALAPEILNTRNSVESAKIYFIGQIP